MGSVSALTLWAATSVASPAGDASFSDGAAPLVDAGSMDLVWFAEQWAAAKCDGLDACCTAASGSYDIRSCKDDAMAFLAIYFSSGPYGYDPQAAAPCFAALRRYYAFCPRAGAGGVCAHVFLGRVPMGGACKEPGECAPVLGQIAWCNGDLRCVLAPRGKVGDACFGDCSARDALCQGNGTNPFGCYDDDGLECSTVSGTCEKARGLVGESCISGLCVAGAHCDMGAGLCRSVAGIGAACNDDSWCDQEASAFCDLTTGRCVRYKAPLESCGSLDRCIVGNCVQGTCPPARGVGFFCDTAPVDGSIVGVEDAATIPLDASSPRRDAAPLRIDAAPPRDAGRAPRADAQASGSDAPDAGTGGGSRDTAYSGRSNGGCSCRISRPAAAPTQLGFLLLGLLVARKPLSLWRRRPSPWRRRRSRSTGCWCP